MRVLMIFALAVVMGCSGSKKAVDTADSRDKEQKNVLTKDSIFLSFERTICFGECPSFVITIYPDGKAKYVGRKFVERKGTYHATVPTDLIADIKMEADRINFFEMKDKYDASVTDVPACITIISGPNGLKQVINRFDGPEELASFEKYLDKVLLNLAWEKEE